MIGAKPESSFAEPLGLIDDCHRRIEHFLGLLVEVVRQTEGQGLNERQRQALERSRRYFHEAAPRHTADETESVFPRLLAVTGLEQEAIHALVATLQADHIQLDQRHAELDRLLGQWLAANTLAPGEVAACSAALGWLQATYTRHLALEEHELLPLAKRVLTPDELTAVGREMATRRGLDYDALLAFADEA